MSDLTPASHPVKNRAFKSSGEDHVVMGVEGQMTNTKMLFHATAEKTGGSCVVYEIHWQPNDASVHHTHSLEDEGFYVIEGQLTLHSAEGEIVLEPGQFGWAPRNVRHAYSVGPEGARVLLVQVPGTGLPDFFRVMAQTGHDPFESEGSFESWNEWTIDNFGVKFERLEDFPPGETVVEAPAVS